MHIITILYAYANSNPKLFLKSEQLGPALWMDKRDDLHVET